jgi:predicted ester cyclase
VTWTTPGRAIQLSHIDINRIANGRIVERWGILDMFGLLQQLGMVPAPPTA